MVDGRLITHPQRDFPFRGKAFFGWVSTARHRKNKTLALLCCAVLCPPQSIVHVCIYVRQWNGKVKSGEIPQEKTPYMQRGGGAWDDSDLAKKNLKSQEGKKIEKKKWSKLDKAYAAVRRQDVVYSFFFSRTRGELLLRAERLF